MRKLVIGMALASTALATPALARDDSWYIEGDVGGVLVEDMLDLAGTDVGKLNTKVGYDAGVAVGYDFGGFRLEAESSYRRASADSFTVGANNYSGSNLSGSASALSFMLNGLLDFGPDDGLQGFVGGGAGIGRVKVVTDTPVAAYDINDSDSDFAWQVLAGIRLPVTNNVDVGLKYRMYTQD
ncbi:MAG TPA: outer membrane beta-barrel protein, partial [Novosphingobium sp.]|nr:outer membrane beta-barrel protein [Novosphingobium sp.]